MALARKIGQTVAKLHAAGLIHGDITTSNILVLDSGTSEVGLFGSTSYLRIELYLNFQPYWRVILWSSYSYVIKII